MIKCSSALVSILLLSTSCSDPRIKNAENAVSSELKDPDSTEFRNVVACASGDGVRGEYNAKNSYGAYVGFKDFIVVDGKPTTLEDLPQWNIAFKRCWGAFAGNDSDIAADNLDAMKDTTDPDDLKRVQAITEPNAEPMDND